MTSIKDSVSTPISDVARLDDGALRQLAAVSVTTAEELLGIIAADPVGTCRLLDIDDVTQLASDAASAASLSAAPSLDSAPTRLFRTGAVAPAGVPTQASAAAIKRRANSSDLAQASGTPGTGTRFLDCFGPVRDQGDRSTCVAYAVCALVECLERRAGSDVDLSEQFLYWAAKEHDRSPGRGGTRIDIAMPRMVADGTCVERIWPYNSDRVDGSEAQGPPPSQAHEDAANHRLSSADDILSQGVDGLRRALDAKQPVAVAVAKFANWTGNSAVKQYGFIPMPLPGTAADDGHAMCAVGYDYDTGFAGGGYFILRNSWGAGFAPESPVAPGHALLPFAYFEEFAWEAFTGSR